MRINYLGTGGGGGIPEIFCSCRICKSARINQGNELRNRSMAIIDDELCIDMPCDARSSFLTQKIDAQKIRYLLVTHNHYDHFLADNLITRPEGANPIEVFISRASGEEIARKAKKLLQTPGRQDMRPICIPRVHFIIPFVPFVCGKFTVVPFPARHDKAVEPVNFLIKADGKTVLWLHDTGFMLDETIDYLRKHNEPIHFISMDCALPLGKQFSDDHMDILHCYKTVKLLRDFGCTNEKTIVYLSHISHLVECTHNELFKQAQEYGFKVAYDGAMISID